VGKFLTAITIGIEEKIPRDPFASHFLLTGALKSYSRMKKWDYLGDIDYFFEYSIL
jgi:hypothetical protein